MRQSLQPKRRGYVLRCYLFMGHKVDDDFILFSAITPNIKMQLQNVLLYLLHNGQTEIQ